MGRSLVFAGLASLCAWALTGAAQAAPRPSADEQRQFLRTAEIIAAVPIGVGVTGAWRLTLTDGATTHDAAFQSIDHTFVSVDASDSLVADSYRHTLAAYELAVLVGLEDMVPVSVPRRWRGVDGAMIWWVDDVLFDEETRLSQKRWPTDLDAWGRDMERMWIFAELVHDRDRHGGNLLYSNDWALHMIDFTRAFGLGVSLLKPYRLRSVEPTLLDRLESLTRRQLEHALGLYVRRDQVDAVLARRDTLVAHFRSARPR